MSLDLEVPADLPAEILRRVQNAPGLWTTDQLCAAFDLYPVQIGGALYTLIRGGHVEKPAEFDDPDPSVRRRTVTYRPTPTAWIVPSDRKRNE
jgi:hypothetical protein